MPYEADISAALQRLRQDVFARGDYLTGYDLPTGERQALAEKLRPELGPWTEKVKKAAAELPEPLRSRYLAFTERVKEEMFGAGLSTRKPAPKPKSIEELLEQRAENGTHSILDIVRVSSKPEFGAISSFPNAKVAEYFETETPNHAEVQEALDSGSLEEFISKRWQGIYIIVYRDGSPHELLFAGCSGD